MPQPGEGGFHIRLQDLAEVGDGPADADGGVLALAFCDLTKDRNQRIIEGL